MLLTVSLLLAPVVHADVGASIVLSLELPMVARDLRRDGIPHAEVRSVILGSRERHLPGHEIHAVLLRSHQAILVNGPVDHFDDLVLVQLDAGVRGPALYVYLDDAHGKHGRKHKGDDVIIVAPGWGPSVVIVDGGDHDDGDHKGQDKGNDKGHSNDKGHGNGKGKSK